MPVTRAVQCPHCASAIDLRTARARTVQCPACDSLIDVRGEPELVAAGGSGERAPHGVLPVGTRTVICGVDVEVVAHLVYQDGVWSWHEYLLVAEDGRSWWLQHDDGEFTVFEPFTPTDAGPVDERSVNLDVEGERHLVLESGSARLTHLEGELTWAARIGDVTRFLDGRRFAVEISTREIEWFRVSSPQLGDLPGLIAKPKSPLEGMLALIAIIAVLIAISVLFPGFFTALMWTGLALDDDGYSGGHYSGGGFSGGK